LGPGANILTGETGAGKSVLAGALELLRGAKASPGLIRAGAEEAKVEALFHLERPEDLRNLFDELDLSPEPDLVVQRSLSQTGRSKARVNGALATVAQLAALGDELLAVSGQHDQQSLVRESRQLDFLDSFGDLAELLKESAAAFREREAAEKVRRELQTELQEAEERRDMIEWHLSEIDRIKPRAGEDEELVDLKSAIKSSAKLSKTLESAEEILSGQSRTEGVVERLERLARLFEKTAQLDERLAPIVEKALEAAAKAQDIAAALDDLAKGLPKKRSDDAETIDDRLSDLAKLKRKHGPTLEAVLEKAAEMRAQLSRMDQAGALLARAKKDWAKAVERCTAAALALRGQRRKAAEYLAANLTATLKVLGFPKLTMSIEVAPIEGDKAPGEASGPKGADSVTFLFCPNPGEG
jgi:DNA repair protein RecN (Recombination protein N)